MIKFNVQKSSFLALILALCGFALTAQAHEFRDLGDGYIIQVGNSAEPPTTGSNKADFFAFYGDFNDPGTWVPLDRTAGDKVVVGGFSAKFATDSYSAPITQVLFPVLYQFTQTEVEETVAYQSNTFNVPSAGAYGFLLAGELKKTGHPKKLFSVKFVCGGGTQDTTYATDFECIEE